MHGYSYGVSCHDYGCVSDHGPRVLPKVREPLTSSATVVDSAETPESAQRLASSYMRFLREHHLARFWCVSIDKHCGTFWIVVEHHRAALPV